MELVCRTAWEMRQATYVYSCSVCQSSSVQGEKVPCQKMREFFFLGIFILSWSMSSGDSVKVSIELNDSRVTSCTEIWQMPYLLVLLYSCRRHTCMHRYIHIYTHTHTHLTADKQTHMHAYTHTGGLILHITETKEISLLCLDLVCQFVVSLQLNHVSRWMLLKIALHQKHVYSCAQLVIGLKCIPFVLSAK